jgi:hypothetical protein
MHKNKDGKVIASLTEVKNKTGDIFALVDEFGEVVLTSYNKPRYKILKIGVSDILESSIETKSTVDVAEDTEESASVMSKVRNKVPSIVKRKVETTEVFPVAEPAVVEAVAGPAGLADTALISALSKMKTWDRNSKKERNFVSSVRVPLQ